LSSLPKIWISTLVRNKARILPEFLRALESLQVPNERVIFSFLINDSTDSSKTLLEDWAAKRENVQIDEINLGTLPDVRGELCKPYPRSQVFKNLAKLRNLEIEDFLRSDAEVLVFLDADVLIKPNSLETLVNYKKGLISIPLKTELTSNSLSVWRWEEPKYLRQLEPKHLRRLPDPFEVDFFAGGYVLFQKEVFKEGLRFDMESSLPEFFALSKAAKQVGIKLWATKKWRLAEHKMLDNLLDYPEEIQREYRKEESLVK
jgi:glycosyltransferase involved in cell wall biosynthesis